MCKIGSAGGGGFYNIGPGGGGGCYEHFREKYEKELNLKILSSRLVIQLLNDLKRARYNYEYLIEITGNEEERNWFFEIPFSEERVTDVWAKDGNGGLQYSKNAEEKNKTKLNVDFRKPINKGDQLKFSFGYTTEVLAIVNEGVFSSTVSYNDWTSHNVQCDNLKIMVNLPPNSKSLKTVPPADLSHNPVIYDVDNLRPLEYYSFLLHYENKKIGKPFWIWLGSAILSGLVGAIISMVMV